MRHVVPPRRGRTLLGLALLFGIGCASIAPPPGGPRDRVAPHLLSTVPDSIAVLPAFRGDAEFRFDEVIAEGGSPNFGFGTGDLERLLLLSPSRGVPVVHWKRNRITVRPREGWKPNTVYRVELLPGIADLANNRSSNGRIITFTTGAPLPAASLRGMVVDWSTQRPARLALVEAILLPDSLAYRSITDSAGRFVLGPIPRGDYLVFGAIDQNNDRRRQTRESFDSVRVAAGRDSLGELWAFRHDTLPARLSSAEPADSLSAALSFSQELDPYQRLPADSVELRALPDSVPVPVLALLPKGQFDTVYAPPPDSATARTDSLRARADSLRADSLARARSAGALRIPGTERRRIEGRDTTGTGPLRTRPPLFDKLYLRSGRVLAPGTRYVVVVHGIRTVSGVIGTARGVLVIPAAKPVADSARARSDTTKKPPPAKPSR